MNALVLPGIALGVSVVSAAFDVRQGRIPNLVTLPALVGALLLRASAGQASVVAGALGCVAAGGPPWLLYRATRGAGIGGGDVKLFAALGALVGATPGLRIEVATVAVLGVFAFVNLAYHGRLWKVLRNVARLIVNPLLPGRWRTGVEAEAFTELRMGPSILVAVISTLLVDRVQAWMPWP